MEGIKKIIRESMAVKDLILKDDAFIKNIALVSTAISEGYKKGNKVLLCGNGGSAADAQHIAAEFSGKFYIDRPPLYAEALHVNTSYLTAVANDFSYDEVFARLVRAKGKSGDFLMAFSTSGNSKNVLKAIEAANEIGMISIGFTGETGGKMKKHCRFAICIPSSNTPRIQEGHIMTGHIICELVERSLFGNV